jgi:hypothetical protein
VRRSIPSAQKAPTAVLDIKPCVQRRMCTGGGRYFPTRSPIGTHDPVSTPLRSKSSRVDKVSIAGGCRMFCSASDSHILSHVRSFSGVGSPVVVAFFSSLDDDNAASLYFFTLVIFSSWGCCLFFMPNRIFSFQRVPPACYR